MRSLSHGDVSGNELFYHTPCLTKYTNQCNSFLNTNNIDSTDHTWIKELILNKVILYIRDTELAGLGTVFMVGELEALYVEMPDGHGIVWSIHISRFAELLLVRVPELLKELLGNKLSVFFDSAVNSLVNIVGLVRQAMRLKCQSTNANFKFDKGSQIESVPVEFLTLYTSHIYHRINRSL